MNPKIVVIQISQVSPLLLLNKSSKENAKIDYQLRYFMGVINFLCLPYEEFSLCLTTT